MNIFPDSLHSIIPSDCVGSKDTSPIQCPLDDFSMLPSWPLHWSSHHPTPLIIIILDTSLSQWPLDQWSRLWSTHFPNWCLFRPVSGHTLLFQWNLDQGSDASNPSLVTHCPPFLALSTSTLVIVPNSVTQPGHNNNMTMSSNHPVSWRCFVMWLGSWSFIRCPSWIIFFTKWH